MSQRQTRAYALSLARFHTALAVEKVARRVDGSRPSNSEMRKVVNAVMNLFVRWVFRALGTTIPHHSLQIEGADFRALVDYEDLDYIRKTWGVDVTGICDVHPRYLRGARPSFAPQLRQPIPRSMVAARCTVEDPRMREALINRVCDFYYTVGGPNNFLSVPPSVIEAMGFTLELFGAPWNTVGNYCSALQIEKEHFGSLGSAFDYEFQPGDVILANPPFDNAMCEMAVERILSELRRVTSASVVLVMSDWTDFRAADLAAAATDLLTAQETLDKEKYRYYSYQSRQFIAASGAFVYFLGANSVPVDTFLEAWLTASAR